MRQRQVMNVLGFFVLPLISMGASLVAIPVLISTGGVVAWTSIAVGQGVGATLALLVSFGWGTVGPALVSRADPADQRHIYWLSAVMRALIFLAVSPLVIAIPILLVGPEHIALSLIACVATTSQGMAPSWYLVGQGRPAAIAAMETGPRAIGQIAATGVAAITENVLWYPVGLVITEIAIATLAVSMIARRETAKGPAWPQITSAAREQWPLAASALVGAGYTRASLPIVSAISLPAAAIYAAWDRVQQVGRQCVRPLISFFQGWVVRRGAKNLPSRPRIATIATVGMGAVGAVIVTFALPALDTFVFSDAIQIDTLQAMLLGLTLIFVTGSSSTTYYYLVPRGAVKVLSVSSLLGSAAGVPLLLALTPAFGATGSMIAIASAEGVVLALQVGFLLFRRGRGKSISAVA